MVSIIYVLTWEVALRLHEILFILDASSLSIKPQY